MTKYYHTHRSPHVYVAIDAGSVSINGIVINEEKRFSIKEDSVVLEHLKVGDVLDMKYYPEKLREDPIMLKTEIKHITKDVLKRIKGHFLIGLSVLEIYPFENQPICRV